MMVRHLTITSAVSAIAQAGRAVHACPQVDAASPAPQGTQVAPVRTGQGRAGGSHCRQAEGPLFTARTEEDVEAVLIQAIRKVRVQRRAVLIRRLQLRPVNRGRLGTEQAPPPGLWLAAARHLY